MKLKITFKTPDAVDYAIEHLNEDEQYEAKESIAYWVKYSECVTIEIDTETNEARVIPV